MRILLAIEDGDLRLSIELLLSQEPSVMVVGEASEAEGLLALIKSSEPDIVILDWDLPGRPMPAFLEEARVIIEQARFIVLCDQSQMKEQAQQAGVGACVVKGESPDQLLNAFRKTRARVKPATDEPIA